MAGMMGRGGRSNSNGLPGPVAFASGALRRFSDFSGNERVGQVADTMEKLNRAPRGKGTFTMLHDLIRRPRP